MKVAIITYPCIGNYGGMLQVYANYRLLQNNSVDVNYYDTTVEFFQREFKRSHEKLKLLLKHVLYIFGLYGAVPRSYFYKSGMAFRKKFLPNSYCQKDIHREMDAFLVGSDQIWRGPIDDGRMLYFLEPASMAQRKRSFAYSASFGMDMDNWEGGSEKHLATCSTLLNSFRSISVREYSGVKICKEVFGVDAVQMPDPTLLLHTEDYGKIIDSEKTWLPNGKYMAAYVLDETAGKAELLQNSAKSVDMQLQHLMPHADAKKQRERFPISVPQWLRLIRDCEYFITDSFHGCVFAIIFNKPFVCLGNEGRGNARFDTLLGTFGLEDRMITDAAPEKVLQILNTPIDWAKVNAIHDAERERGINYLKENLT